MKLDAGDRLGPYEIQAPLGAGGMGEVFRARDTRLGRDVAIKILPDRLAGNASAMARFEREARAVAALSHPNIVAIHDFGTDGGTVYTVTELLEGETLARQLGREAMSWKKALEIGASIAEGLASAHSHGIVHRDLKPANVFLTRDSVVKILDFGLARGDPLLSQGAATRAPTETSVPETEPGTVLGTAGYMSPEQVRGEPADARSDIFSFGCVLYEMLTGVRAFPGKTSPEILAGILRDQPREPSESGREVPAAAASIAMRCLEKMPEQRFQSARDLAFALREILAGSTASFAKCSDEMAAIPSRRPRAGLWAAAALVSAATLAALLFGGIRRIFPSRAGNIRSLAVLPLSNFSGDPRQEDFADAMTEELITRLARLGNWSITSRTSIMGYKGTKKKAAVIARELGVDALVAGSVAREGQQVKVTAQLIDARADRNLWAESYERQIQNVLALQGDIARAIAEKVGLALTPEGTKGLDAAATRIVAPAAFDAYVRGRHSWNKRTEADLREGIRLFQEAIDADPTFAPAFAGMADCYGQLGYGSYVAPEDAFPRARAAAQKALELDPNLAEAHASLGFALMYYEWSFPAAEKEFRRAIELNPSYAIGHQWYAYLLTALERPVADTEREIATAKRLDPLSVPINTDQAYMLYYYGKPDEALKAVRTALEMNPKFPPAFFWLGRIYTSQGRYADAEAALQKIGQLRTWTPAMAQLGFLYAKEGKRKEAEAILEEFAELGRKARYPSSYAVAIVLTGLGEREKAFQTLDAAIRERSHWLVWLKRDPRWNDIRSDPRFQNLARKVGLPP